MTEHRNVPYRIAPAPLVQMSAVATPAAPFQQTGVASGDVRRRRTSPPRTSWDPLQIAVAVFLMTAVGNIHLVFPILLPLRLTILGAAAAIALYYADKSRSRRLALTWVAPTSKMIVALLGWMTFSIPVAVHRGVAFSTVVDDFSKTVILFFLIVGAARTVGDVNRLTLIYFLGTVINAVFATQGFDAGGGDAWRMGDVNGRWDANDFAVVSATGIPLGIYFAQRYHPIWIRLVAAGSLYFLVTSVVLSGSRGGFLALVATLGAVLTQFRAIKFTWRITGAAAAVIVLATVGGDRYWQQMRTILNPSEDYNVTDQGGRIAIWKRGVSYALKRPLTGVGAQCFSAAEGFISSPERRRLQEQGYGMHWFAAHNAYVQVLAEVGFPGFAFFMIAIGAAVRGLVQVRKARWSGDPRGPPIADAQLAALLGYLVGIVFLSHAYEGVLWSQLALAVATWKATRLEGPPPKPGGLAPGRRRGSWPPAGMG